MTQGTESEEDRAGYVYILVNSALTGLVKIGLTRGTAKRRASDLSSGTGIPTPFIVAYEQLVADCVEVERRLHEKFAPFRENARREFFRITPREAIDALQGAARFSPFVDDEEVKRIDILPAFDARCRRWLRRDIVGLSYLQTESLCAIEVVRQEAFHSRDLKVDRVDIDFITDGVDPFFSPELDPEENARRFVSLDSYSLIMCFDLLDEDVASWIDEEHTRTGEAPYGTKLPNWEGGQ